MLDGYVASATGPQHHGYRVPTKKDAWGRGSNLVVELGVIFNVREWLLLVHYTVRTSMNDDMKRRPFL